IHSTSPSSQLLSFRLYSSHRLCKVTRGRPWTRIGSSIMRPGSFRVERCPLSAFSQFSSLAADTLFTARARRRIQAVDIATPTPTLTSDVEPTLIPTTPLPHYRRGPLLPPHHHQPRRAGERQLAHAPHDAQPASGKPAIPRLHDQARRIIHHVGPPRADERRHPRVAFERRRVAIDEEDRKSVV